MPVSPLAQAVQLINTGRVFEAIDECRRVIATMPNHMPAHHTLARACLMADRHLEALDAIHEAILLAPEHPQVHADHGKILHALERYEDAEEALRESLRLKPGNDYATITLVNLMRSTGRFADAGAALDDALAANPNDVKMVFELVRIAHRIGREHEAIELVTRRIDAGLPPQSAAEGCFALAELFDRMGEYADAWAWVERANALRGARFDSAALTAEADAMIKAWSPNRFPLITRLDEPAELPVFIIGMPRSGTSLVEQILGSHPGVNACGELTDIPWGARRVSGREGAVVTMLTEPERFRRSDLQQIREGYIARLRRDDQTAERATDKLPQNGFYLGLIWCMLPGARVIRCKRNPVDVALSCYFQDFNLRPGWLYSPESIAAFYRENERVIDHYAEVLDLPVLEVRYEELVADPEPQMRRLVDFIGLDWDPACLRFHESDRVVRTASNDQVRRPLYTSSVSRHERYGPLADPLRNALNAHGLI